MSAPRLPAHVEVGGLIRAVGAAGGFGTVIAKGEREAGTIMVVCCHQGAQARAFERMPRPDGEREWVQTKTQDAENPYDFHEYCQRRRQQDSDLWIVELDHENAASLLKIA